MKKLIHITSAELVTKPCAVCGEGYINPNEATCGDECNWTYLVSKYPPGVRGEPRYYNHFDIADWLVAHDRCPAATSCEEDAEGNRTQLLCGAEKGLCSHWRPCKWCGDHRFFVDAEGHFDICAPCSDQERRDLQALEALTEIGQPGSARADELIGAAREAVQAYIAARWTK